MDRKPVLFGSKGFGLFDASRLTRKTRFVYDAIPQDSPVVLLDCQMESSVSYWIWVEWTSYLLELSIGCLSVVSGVGYAFSSRKWNNCRLVSFVCWWESPLPLRVRKKWLLYCTIVRRTIAFRREVGGMYKSGESLLTVHKFPKTSPTQWHSPLHPTYLHYLLYSTVRAAPSSMIHIIQNEVKWPWKIPLNTCSYTIHIWGYYNENFGHISRSCKKSSSHLDQGPTFNVVQYCT
jgi:hypothetical protein